MSKHEHQHAVEVMDHTATTITNPVATGAALMSGALTWVFTHQNEILFVLMATVFCCQIGAFGYRFFRWLTGGDD